MIFKKNAIWAGLVIGLLLPIIGYFVLLTLFEQLEAAGFLSQEGFSSNFRQRTLGIVSICLNIFPMNIFQKKRFTESMRGIVIPTVLYVILWVAYFGKQIF